MRAETRDILRLARTVCPDAVIEHTSGGHLRVRIIGPNGSRSVFVAATTSDHRAHKNMLRDFRGAARLAVVAAS